MFYTLLGRIITAFITMLAFFTNLTAAQMPAETLENGIQRVAYGEQACEVMDICLPDSPGEADVILLIHGGAWLVGDQTQYDSYLVKIAEAGYVGISVDYSKINNGADCEKMLSEIEAAVSLAKTMMDEEGITADKMAVVGHSAGAQLALMFGYTRFESCPIEIAFVMSNSAIVDFFIDGTDGSTTFEKSVSVIAAALCGTFITENNSAEFADVLKTINPVDNITADVPPTLVVQGNADTMVPYENALLLCEKLEEVGVDHELVTYDGVDHFLRSSDLKCDYARFTAFERFAELYF